MYLKAINLKGFKSFPDRTRLTFSPGVSVIVGPNGSGKSNITDAVLWALGEQSPSAVRGHQMRDVIFAGGKGQSPRRFAEVEVVIDNSEGRAASEFSEISISRRIERNGDGEYRLNGARCRLTDVVEALSDTNMGREAHSVISQGKVEAIVSSKPRDRRLLIEEAAGLGKHRKRRHSAQLKLDRTRDNLERAMDVEREARSRLRPLKRQAEAAERTAKLLRQTNELRARIVADDLRAQQEQLTAAETELAKVRATRDSVEKRFEEVRARRTAIEERIAAGEEGRRRQGETLAEARAATERVRARAEALEVAERDLRGALGERQLRLDALDEEPEDATGAARVAELEAELAKLGEDASEEGERLRGEAGEAEQRRAAAKAALEPLERAEEEISAVLHRATQMHEMARTEAQKASERRAALAGELAAVEAKLAAAAVEGEHEALAGMLEAGSGLERAVSAVLGERLRASIVGSVDEGRERLAAAEGAARALISSGPTNPTSSAPKDGARRLLDLIEAHGEAAPITERLLADAWLVDDFDELAEGFAGVAVTVDGECYDAAAGEIRRLPREGTDPALAARSEREELASRLAQREQTEERARRDLERTESALAEARGREEESQKGIRDARRALDQAAEEASRTGWLAERHAEREGEGSGTAIQRAKLEAELAAERRHAEGAERAREKRQVDREELERRIALEQRTLPALGRARDALRRVAERLEARAAKLAETEGEDGGDVAAELRECSQQEFGLQAELREASEAMTVAEVEATQLRGHHDESTAELQRLGAALSEELGAAAEPLTGEERETIETKLARLDRNREQIGPVNPLAEREYGEAREHVTELAEQRKDLEKAITELRALVRRTDREIAAAFEETFEATARGFEEMVAELFPGGKGRLRRVDVGPRPFAGQAPEGEGDAPADPDEEILPPDDDGGVEIEVTPAGKSTRRLSLLSGGEKSLVALAFVFAVLMARPCPFYILDEVEAALDDINIDRFLRLVRRFAERSQFIVVTHQKRTMDAADILYGVSMGGDGITKVVSRKLPRDELETLPGGPEAADAAAEAA
ncbi:MAG TPA: AAA family ATPase [Solirubrobacterales bacterium]|nr:AAA family ATPase [Solirubrobacterales bacterium]